MSQKIEELIHSIKVLQEELEQEFDTVRDRFSDEFIRQQRRFKVGIVSYLLDTHPFVFLTAPIIYACVIPFVLLICSPHTSSYLQRPIVELCSAGQSIHWQKPLATTRSIQSDFYFVSNTITIKGCHDQWVLQAHVANISIPFFCVCEYTTAVYSERPTSIQRLWNRYWFGLSCVTLYISLVVCLSILFCYSSGTTFAPPPTLLASWFAASLSR